MQENDTREARQSARAVSTRALMALFAVLVALGVFAISALPTQDKHALHIQGTLHPWLHFFSFALLAALAVLSTRNHAARTLLVVALLGFAYMTEARESRKDGWPIEQQDVRTDAIGVLAGTALGLVLGRKRLPRSQP